MTVFLPKILITISLLGQWQGSGPEGGFVRAVAAGNGVTYAYTDQGLYRRGSDPAWKRIETPNLNLLKDGGVNQLVMFADSLVACTRKHGLLISRDSGVTWSNLGDIPADAEVVGMVPVIDSIYSFFAATRNHGVWKYDWLFNKKFVQVEESWAFPGREIAAIAAKPERDNAAIAIDGERVVKIWNPSTSKNWEDSTYLPSGLVGRILSMGWIGDRAFVGTANGAAFVEASTLAWQADVSFGDRFIRNFCVWTPSIWGATNKGVISNIGGVSPWTESNGGFSSLDAFCLTTTSPLSTSGLAGTSDGVYVNSGSAWSVYGSLRAQTFTGLEIDPLYPKTAYVISNGGGFYKTPDASLSWKRWGLAEFTSGLSLSSSKGSGSYVYLYAGNASGIAVSKNGGEAWVQHPDNLGRPVICVAASLAVPEECWFVTRQNFPSGPDSFVVYRTTNACESAIEVSNLADDAPRDMTYSPIDRKMFLITDNAALYRSTTTGGVEKVAAALPAKGVQLETGGGGRLFLLGDAGKIYTSSNAGDVWDNYPSPSTAGTVKRIAADTSSAGFLAAAVASGSVIDVFFTTDTGKTWTRIAQPFQGEVQGLRTLIQGQLGHAYLATPAGVSYTQFTVSTQPSDLELTITPVSESFQPEIGSFAVFNLGGADFSKVTSWSVIVRDTAANEIFSKSGDGQPSAQFQWDGFTASGWLPPAGIYTATFSGQTGQGEASGKADASVNLIIGNPPQGTSTDATAGNRLLLQYPQASGDLGNLYYRSRDVPELFSVAYNSEGEGSFFYGQGVSNSRDLKTALASITMAQDGSNWHTWVDVATSGQTYVLVRHSVPDYSVDTVAAFSQGTSVIAAAITVTADTAPVIALVRKNSTEEVGDIYYRNATSWILDTSFTKTATTGITDLDIVTASDGVHVFYAADSGYGVRWTAPDAALERESQPAIKELSAASMWSDHIYLVYTDPAGRLYFREKAAGSWSSPTELEKGSAALAASNVSCNVNADGKVTVAWQEAGGVIYYNQRTGSAWASDPLVQTPSGSAFYPQLPQCTYSSSQPLIAWTEGTVKPYFIRVVPLGEAPPPDTIVLDVYAPQSLTQGSVLGVALKTQRMVDSMKVHLESVESAEQYWPDYRNPSQDSTYYDTLTASFSDTATSVWPVGQYRLIAEAHLGSMATKIEDTLNVTSVEPDTTVLVDPAEVFFLPNPAVRRSTAKIYYNLSVDATAVEIEIYTARGKNISSYETADAAAVSAGVRKFLEVDISGLGADVYFFRFTAADDSLEAVTIIKPFVVVR